MTTPTVSLEQKLDIRERSELVNDVFRLRGDVADLAHRFQKFDDETMPKMLAPLQRTATAALITAIVAAVLAVIVLAIALIAFSAVMQARLV